MDSQLVSQIEEQKYWSALLERIIEVVKFLAERSLAFCGSDEKIGSHNNGNYLGLLDFWQSLTDLWRNVSRLMQTRERGTHHIFPKPFVKSSLA